jgi:hypothetical protein
LFLFGFSQIVKAGNRVDGLNFLALASIDVNFLGLINIS